MTLRLLPYTPERDAYRLLGVPPTASLDEIGMACRRLARTFHPDHNRSPRATQEMQVVNAVRRAMTDPSWRATYDRERKRFHAQRVRTSPPVVSLPPPPVSSPLRLEMRPLSPALRYARAVGVGLSAAARAMLPPRCMVCHGVVEPQDAYCAGCGARLSSRAAQG